MQRSSHEVDTKAEQINKHDEVNKEQIMVTLRTPSHFEEKPVEKASEIGMPEAISPKVEKDLLLFVILELFNGDLILGLQIKFS